MTQKESSECARAVIDLFVEELFSYDYDQELWIFKSFDNKISRRTFEYIIAKVVNRYVKDVAVREYREYRW